MGSRLGDDRAARDAIDVLADEELDWQDAPAWAMYGWYYLTQTKYQAGGKAWNAWHRRFANAYIGRQREDGSWVSPGHYEKFHGPVLATTLGALTLQVYYRYLPTYQQQTASAARGEDEDDEVEAFTVL